jgi:hypothetical protein
MTNLILTGKAYWARVYEGNHDEFGGKEFYKITVALDNESWSKYSTSGLGLKPKAISSEDDTLGITFRRDVHAKSGVGKNGKPWSLGGGPPLVINEDGNEMDDLIGNGSVVQVKIDTYKVANGPMKGKSGHRLEAVKVLELVSYEPPEDDGDEPEVVEETKPVTKSSSVKKGLPF